MVGAPDCPAAPEPSFLFHLQLAPDDPLVFNSWRRSNLMHLSIENRNILLLFKGAPDNPLATPMGRRIIRRPVMPLPAELAGAGRSDAASGVAPDGPAHCSGAR